MSGATCESVIRPGVAEEACAVARFGGPCTYSAVSLVGFVKGLMEVRWERNQDGARGLTGARGEKVGFITEKLRLSKGFGLAGGPRIGTVQVRSAE